MKKLLIIVMILCIGLSLPVCARTVRLDHPVEIINKDNHKYNKYHNNYRYKRRRPDYAYYACKNGICRWYDKPAPLYTHSPATSTPKYVSGATYIRPLPKDRPPMPGIKPNTYPRPAMSYSYSAR